VAAGRAAWRLCRTSGAMCHRRITSLAAGVAVPMPRRAGGGVGNEDFGPGPNHPPRASGESCRLHRGQARSARGRPVASTNGNDAVLLGASLLRLTRRSPVPGVAVIVREQHRASDLTARRFVASAVASMPKRRQRWRSAGETRWCRSQWTRSASSATKDRPAGMRAGRRARPLHPRRRRRRPWPGRCAGGRRAARQVRGSRSAGPRGWRRKVAVEHGKLPPAYRARRSPCSSG